MSVKTIFVTHYLLLTSEFMVLKPTRFLNNNKTYTHTYLGRVPCKKFPAGRNGHWKFQSVQNVQVCVYQRQQYSDFFKTLILSAV